MHKKKRHLKNVTVTIRGFFLLTNYQEASEGMQRCMVSHATRDDSPEEVKKRAMADPEVQQIMSDPAMRMILEQMHKDPQALNE